MSSSPRPLHWRAIVTLYVVFSFAVMITSGLVLYLAPPGRIANWTGWTLIGLTRHQWQSMHTIFSFLFIVAGSFHLYFNWKVILTFLRRKADEGMHRGRELMLTTAAGVVLLTLVIAGTFPFSFVMQLGEELSASWSNPQTDPPLPHAELLRFEDLAQTLNTTPEGLVSRLRAAGYVPDSGMSTLRDLAERYGVHPSDVYRVLDVPGESSPTIGTGGGYGKRTVAEVCDLFAVTASEGLVRLRRSGIEATPSSAIRTLAQQHHLSPMDVVRIIVPDADLPAGETGHSPR